MELEEKIARSVFEEFKEVFFSNDPLLPLGETPSDILNEAIRDITSCIEGWSPNRENQLIETASWLVRAAGMLKFFRTKETDNDYEENDVNEDDGNFSIYAKVIYSNGQEGETLYEENIESKSRAKDLAEDCITRGIWVTLDDCDLLIKPNNILSMRIVRT